MKINNSGFRMPLRLKIFLKRLAFVLLLLATILFCGLMAGGAWNALVSVINAIIEGGAATIISSVVVVVVLYYCVLPILALSIFIGLAVFINNL